MISTVKEKLRLSHVKRWNIVRVAREQTVAEHSYLVWVITGEMLKYSGFSPADKQQALEWALAHDQPEAIYGDIPTPTKLTLDSYADEIKMKVAERCPYWAEVYTETTAQNSRLIHFVKMADIAEAVWFLRDEGIGEHAKAVLKLLRQQLKGLLSQATYVDDQRGLQGFLFELTGEYTDAS